jgi:hypothetical protein
MMITDVRKTSKYDVNKFTTEVCDGELPQSETQEFS